MPLINPLKGKSVQSILLNASPTGTLIGTASQQILNASPSGTCIESTYSDQIPAIILEKNKSDYYPIGCFSNIFN